MPKQASRDVVISETMQALRRIIKALQDYSQKVSYQFGVTGPQLWALKTLSQNGDLALGELSKRMYLHPSTITGLVDRLEKKDLVSRQRNEEDRRVITIHLTSKGIGLAKKAPHPIQGKMVYGLRRLKKHELHSILNAVQKLTEIMEAEHVKATFFFDQE
ncbi:MAG TPA: MarR family transcriptional regulator [Thermodesulfobacteriota bacterium]|nr:MarR family transcriptional regulator [Thermodesulfobacteriota bacterium]